MKYLLDYFETDEILELISINSDIKDLDEENANELIRILKDLGCEAKSIKDIIYANPFYLNRFSSDIEKLIIKLKSLGIETLNEVFTGNPWLLDKDAFEIDEYIKEKTEEHVSLEDIIESIIVNPSF